MKRFALACSPLLAFILVGFLAAGHEGTVGSVRIGVSGLRLVIDLHGHVAPAGASSVGVRRRVVVSPDRHWQAVVQLPGMKGNTGSVAIGRNEHGATLRIVERHLFVGTAPRVIWSPDSRWLAMTTWVPHIVSAVAVSPDGRRRVLAAPYCGDFQSGTAWAPRGDRIALAVPRPGQGCAQGIDLRIQRVDEAGRRVIARGIAGVPVWSPDGRWIATTGGDVEVMRADGTRRRHLGGSIAVWSPHGDVLAIAGLHGQTLSITPASGGIARWDSNLDTGLAPRFSPDGRLIAYRRWDAIIVRRLADRRVFLRVPTTQNVQLTGLTWAPDGHSLRVVARIQAG